MTTAIVPPVLTPVERTIYLTVVSRARDAESPDPILGDTWSIRVREALDYDFDGLAMPVKEKFTVAIRGRQLDDWCRAFIDRHRDAVVVELGCGLDDRAARISPPTGVDWYDVDLEGVMNLRARLDTPVSGRVHPIIADATDTAWLDALPHDRPVFVIADGFIPFVEKERFIGLLQAIVDHFPSGEIAMNGYTTLAARLLKNVKAVQVIGLAPSEGSAFDDPHTPEIWEPRLRLASRQMLSRSAYVSRMPIGQRIACRVLNWIPSLAAKADAGVLRYEF